MVMYPKTSLSLQCLGRTTVLVQSLICLLAVYALVIKGGKIVIDGCKTISFHDCCLYNTTSGGCHCLSEFDDLQSKSTTSALSYVRFMTYSSLVVVFIGLVILVLTQYIKDDILRTLNLPINILSLVGFFNGISNHLYIVWDHFDFAHLTLAFLALLLAVTVLILQTCLICRYIQPSSESSTAITRAALPRTTP
ncbi:hypothetical protein GDO78_014665 [Eleutherodactylus coqui]|uniref:Uncharacterized protein n=1 Tax=Eleutherodactylus coqui TaxID=57060 RepID=A0A8J6JPW3_ELECQ|nr:hypothetical protein GDO78_014665 [Eleutherodactylus coqui]